MTMNKSICALNAKMDISYIGLKIFVFLAQMVAAHVQMTSLVYSVNKGSC